MKMRISSIFLAFAPFIGDGFCLADPRGTITATAPASPFDPSVIGPNFPGPVTRYIIEAYAPTNVSSIATALLAADPSAKIARKWTDELLPGLSCDSALPLDSIQSLDGVRSAWGTRNDLVPPPEDGPKAEQPPLNRRDAPEPEPEVESYSEIIHKMTGVNRLHKAGILGAGAKIAILDTGTYYGHQGLTPFGPTIRPEANPGALGYSRAELAGHSSVQQTGQESAAGFEDTQRGSGGHGAQVAGVIAGKGHGFVGVAPQASLMFYKLHGPEHGRREEQVMDAWKQAYRDGADIISMSVAADGAGFTDSPISRLAERLVDSGLIIVVAAGSRGRTLNPFWISPYCGSIHTLCVASVNPNALSGYPLKVTATPYRGNTTTETTIGVIDPKRITIDPPPRPYPTKSDGNFRYEDTMDSFREIWGVPMRLYLATGPCPVPRSPIPTDPNRAVALMKRRRAPCRMEYSRPIQGRGPRYVLIYDDLSENMDWYLHSMEKPDFFTVEFDGRPRFWTAPEIRMGLIDSKAGATLLSLLESHKHVDITFEENKIGMVVPVENNGFSGLVSPYSSWGGTFDLALKPDISAPGTGIYSTYLVKNGTSPDPMVGTWPANTGTSMAAPYVAGVAALYIGKHGGRSTHGPEIAKKIINRIRSSGIRRSDLRGHDRPSAMVTGSGIINAVKVVNYQTSLTFTSLSLNDTANFRPEHKIVVTNEGPEPLSYSLSHDALSTLLARTHRRKVVKRTASVEMPKGNFTIAPGKSKTVLLRFSPPKRMSIRAKKWPVYNGRILVHASNGEELAVPYMGAAFDLKKEVGNLLHHADIAGPQQSHMWREMCQGHRRDKPEGYNSNRSASTRVALQWDRWRTTTPGLTHVTFHDHSLEWGTRKVRLDAFKEPWNDSDWRWPPETSRGYAGTAYLPTATSDVVGVMPEPLPEGMTSISGSDPASWNYFPKNAWIMSRRYKFRYSTPIFQYAFPWLWKVEQTMYLHWDGNFTEGRVKPYERYQVRLSALRPFGNPTEPKDWSVAKFPPPLTVVELTPCPIRPINTTDRWFN
ncbi:peptidase S8/S53 domain-containing protein [Cercophora scortea]|uniref:Peptidase S8/S53 domain-containing protein n=1 Tax=Cercophora scortea TaxID=314031 RepID=A0AAE0I8M3_9PEZI|nr:peptidase S8/S53 domain-containing protein [Cercophora scortea]